MKIKTITSKINSLLYKKKSCTNNKYSLNKLYLLNLFQSKVLKISVLCLFIIYNVGINETLFSQNIGINGTGAAPNAAALLDVDAAGISPKKGLLVPRMTTAERNAIPAPPQSLLVFNTTIQCFQWWNTVTSQWISFGCVCPTQLPLTALAASGIGPTTFTADWSGIAGAVSYYLDVNTNNTFTGTQILNNMNVGNNISYNVTGLTCGQTYYYRVRALNNCGSISVNSNVITVTVASCCPTSYAVSSIAYSPIAGSGTTVTLSDDQVSAALNIGFDFCFYGTTYTQFYMSSNGFITFLAGQPSGCCNGVVIPNAGTPNGIIAACWTDLNTAYGGSFDYFTTGAAPNRRLVVRYNSVGEHAYTGFYYNGQIILYETTNVIEIHSQRYNISGHTVAVGVENQTGTLGAGVAGYNTVTAPNTTNVAWRFQ